MKTFFTFVALYGMLPGGVADNYELYASYESAVDKAQKIEIENIR